MNLVVTACAIHGWLRVDRQEAELVKLRELSLDNGRLWRRRRIGPRESLKLAQTEACEKGRDFCERAWVTPKLECFFFLSQSLDH
jgi:hypothetical protein